MGIGITPGSRVDKATTQGDTIYYDGSAYQRLAKGTASQVLTMNAGATAPEWAAASGGSGSFQYVDSTTLGSAGTTIDVTGLDLGTDKHYVISVSVTNATASAADISLFYQTGGSTWQTTATDYYIQKVQSLGSTISAARANVGFCGIMGASDGATINILIEEDTDGYTRAKCWCNWDGPAAISNYDFTHIYNSTTNITGIRINGTQNFDTGSKVVVWKKNES